MNELQQLEQLLQQLLGAVQQVMASGEEMPDDFQAEIATTLTRLFERIQTLRQEEPPTQIQPNTDKLRLSKPFPSSNIHSFGYDDKNGKLLVRFQDKFPNQNGPVYAYEGVPKNIFELFRQGAIPARTNGRNDWGEWWKGKVPSLGASLYTLIKNGGYQYHRLT